MTNSDKKWYALYTNPRAEKKTAELLRQKGITVYLPLQVTLRQWSDRKKKVEEPLFKSYLFVCITLAMERIPVLETQGVVKFVRIGQEVPVIRPQIIEAIQMALHHYPDMEVESSTLQPSDTVKIVSGPLHGFTGTIVEKSANSYFSLNIPELQSQLLIKVPATYLQKI